MATDFISATDAILSTFKVAWDAQTPALTVDFSSAIPQIVFEAIEPDLTPHPKDGNKPWTRIVVRNADANKVTLNNSTGVARYRRVGIAWVQIYVPATSAKQWTLAQKLAMVAQKAYEGKRAAGRDVVFTKSTIIDRPKEGAFFTFDVKVNFYWDEIR